MIYFRLLCSSLFAKEACHSDNGEAVVYRSTDSDIQWTVAGIIGWGWGCGQDLPAVNYRVSHYMDVIKKHAKCPQTVEEFLSEEREFQ